ncbi:LAMI_0D12772g1_1 [Lachancea mirantina]|uniref:LAMI_0D12772g1_1 n=1 Tax=Lachancea mirantina TaxID=1230905 RepID=A0A1G4JGB8_9SACH|nr:LAMI_0D12772g1_1 [Lachancea mirantina]
MTTDTVQPATESYVFQGTINKKPPHVLDGQGVRMKIEKNGKIYDDVLDGVTGAAVGALGWGDEDLPAWLEKAAKNHTYTFPSLIGNPASEDLAKFYIDNSPKGAFAAALWCCSGSESNENAMKIIRQYQVERGCPEKYKIISRDLSYHGFTLGALSISNCARASAFKDILIDQEKTCLTMEPCYPYRFQKKGESEEQYVKRLLDNLEKIILDNDPKTVSCVIVETLPGSSLGTCPSPKGYLPGIRALCNKYDVVFMLDEVMCGTGRCNPNGKLNCWENFLEPEDAPDIQSVGKTLGSGFVTIAGVLVGPKIRDAYIKGSNAVFGSHTYASHGFNCSVALDVQKKIQAQGLTANIFKMGNLMGSKLQDALLDKDNIVGDVRGIGGFWSLEFVKDRTTKEVFPAKLDVGHRFQDVCFENGLNVMGMQGNADGISGDIALLAPSFIVTEDDVNEIVKRVVKSVEDITEQLKAEGNW